MENNGISTPCEGLRTLTIQIRPVIAGAVETICRKHVSTLMLQPPCYISSAVWGADRKDPLDTIQMDIKHICECLEKDLFHLLDLGEIAKEQHFALHYFFRELLLIKICFTLEHARQESRFFLEGAGTAWANEATGHA